MYSYCDCRNSKGKFILDRANLGYGKMQLTPSDKNGSCVYCGHITVKTKEPLIQKHRSTSKFVVENKGIAKYIRG